MRTGSHGDRVTSGQGHVGAGPRGDRATWGTGPHRDRAMWGTGPHGDRVTWGQGHMGTEPRGGQGHIGDRVTWGQGCGEARATLVLSSSQRAGLSPVARSQPTSKTYENASRRPQWASCRTQAPEHRASEGFSVVPGPLEAGSRWCQPRSLTRVDPARGSLSAARPQSLDAPGPLRPRFQLHFTPQETEAREADTTAPRGSSGVG